MSKPALEKKKAQLGMNPSTASARLLKDIIFECVVNKEGHKCHQCGDELTRDDFSIEHIEPWLDSDDPVGHFFDLNNIAFSHKGCNYSVARRPHKYKTEEERLAARRKNNRNSYHRKPTEERQKIRRERWLRTGN